MTTIKILDGDVPVKLEWLRSFLAIVDTGGFTKAAKKLRMSQPAVSTHIHELEKNLGAPLFEKIGCKPLTCEIFENKPWKQTRCKCSRPGGVGAPGPGRL